MEVTRAGADANSLALRQLRTWTSECSSLRVFMVLGSPKNFEAYVSKRLDGKPGLSASELDDTWYYCMLVYPPLSCLVVGICLVMVLLCPMLFASDPCCKFFARFHVDLYLVLPTDLVMTPASVLHALIAV